MEYKRRQYIKTDQIKTLLRLPEFTGIQVQDFPLECNMNEATSSVKSDFNHIPEEIRATQGNTYASSEISACGDQLIGWREQINQKTAAPKLHKTQSWIETKTLSTYPKYKNIIQPSTDLHDKPDYYNPENLHAHHYHGQMHNFGFGKPNMQSGFCGTNSRGHLRITSQATLSLSLSDSLQVDITIDGAIRIINPKAFIAMSVNGMGTQAAVMHPMGRVLKEASTANILAYDMNHGCHKLAKLWQKKATFTSTDMTFSYTMDQAGTRTTMTAFPSMPSNDITLPVFLATSQHGNLYIEEATEVFKQTTCGIDCEGATVWTINNVMIKYNNGDLRVMGPHSVFLRTSAFTGHLGLSTETLHCTASTGKEPHFFVRFGVSKMHYNGQDFKLRTLSQAAGFDANNRITLF